MEKSERRPTILVLEGLSGAAECVFDVGGSTVEAWPTNIDRSCELIDSEHWDGLVLTGGGDIDPRVYGQRPRKEVYGVNETRDMVETYALETARAKDVPVLGICRGAQMINVEAGGTLKQHVTGHRGDTHKVLTRKDTILRKHAGLDPTVKSLHHQHVDRVAPGFLVSSLSPDHIIESVESKDRRCLAVQFHPEMDFAEDYARGIFRWLVLEAAERAGLQVPSQRPTEESKWKTSQSYYLYDDDDLWLPRRQSQIAQPPIVPNSIRSSSGTNAVRRIWMCPDCALKFDGDHAEKDRDDHVLVLHGEKAFNRMMSKRGSKRGPSTVDLTNQLAAERVKDRQLQLTAGNTTEVPEEA